MKQKNEESEENKLNIHVYKKLKKQTNELFEINEVIKY